MSLEESITKSPEIKPAKAEQEAVIKAEKSPEEIEKGMSEKAGNEVADFNQAGEDELEHAEEKITESGLQVNIKEEVSELVGLNQEAKQAKDELRKEVSSGGQLEKRDIDQERTQEKENLSPEEKAFKEVIGSIGSFVKNHSENCKGKSYEEIANTLTNSEELGEIGNQVNENNFFAFAKKNPDKAVQYILSVDDSNLEYMLTGELIDIICRDIRFTEKKEMGDMLEIYDKFFQHIGNKESSGNLVIETIKAQRQIALIERELNSDNCNFSKLISDYNEVLNNPNTENYRTGFRFVFEKKLERHFKELVDQNKDQEAMDLYSKIQYSSLFNNIFEKDSSLLPEAGKSLINALESREAGEYMDKAEENHYGQRQDKLLNLQQKFLKEYPEIYFNSVMKNTLEISNIPRNKLGSFLENIKNLSHRDKESLLNQEVIESLCNLDQEKQAKIIKIAKTLANSPSSEIQRFKSELIVQLANSENPKEDFEKVESIFLKNCLPVVGKVNKVFQALYGGDKFKKLVGEKASPVLQKESIKGRQFQIYKDLLNIHLKSNNESLRDYLEAFLAGKSLFEKIDKEGMNSLNQEEQRSLDYMLKRLEMLYESSWLKNKGEKNIGATLESRMDNIKKSLMLKNGQGIIQRLEEMYLNPIGLKTIDQSLEVMNQSCQEAEQRGFSYAREFTENGGAKLNNGDLLKGINFRYLEKILQNGSVAKEFLGDSSSSDATPLDTDVAMIKKKNPDSTFKKIISDSAASTYGELIIILKNRGQFFESTKGGSANPNEKNKLELFFTGVVDEEHYGIRTGFPSTEIDFFVAKSTLREEELKNIYMDISKNNVYTPVVNDEGKLLFTPDMYKSLKPKDYDFSNLNSENIEKNINEEKFDPQSLLDSFKEVFSEEYKHESGTWEGYSIENHTLKVLSQFEKYFAKKDLPADINKQFFRLLLALHDIGKPQAIDVGDKKFQHYYTMPILKKVFELEGFTAKEIRLGKVLIGEDPIGIYLQNGKIEDSAQYIMQKSAESGMTPEELLDLFLIMYKVDAGSYTEDAGGQKSLDNLFEFDKSNKTINFSKEIEKKIEALRNMIKR